MELENKLKKYEAIEMDLGIPLEVLFKALKEGIYCKFQSLECRHITHFKKISLAKLYSDWELWIIDDNEEREFIRKLRNYGKTWALTREELQ